MANLTIYQINYHNLELQNNACINNDKYRENRFLLGMAVWYILII